MPATAATPTCCESGSTAASVSDIRTPSRSGCPAFVRAAQPPDQLRIDVARILDRYPVGDHRIPAARRGQPAGRGRALQLDADVKALRGHTDDGELLPVPDQADVGLGWLDTDVGTEPGDACDESGVGFPPASAPPGEGSCTRLVGALP